ncbi:gluconate 2-dehydrogenase subunit 3 family protein [Cohnella caldifontis]|uniref:gluconate 2-dehydrogenase subunit 3 family protein n=1 Tax=Cohnella caldifontis TaxID=3027471 RepID=UPI0023EB9902|nr:gluconate 2-dehydrogenase subunit 3 family protein [Cohnella sp. YIM B05605]
MPEYEPHYPRFDVMREEENWDPHTREIVTKRLKNESFYPYRYLTQHEGDTLFRLCAILLDDARSPVLAYVVFHFDSTLQAGIGEAQRKIGVPKQSELIRDGLALLDQVCTERHGNRFISMEESDQRRFVGQLVRGEIGLSSGGRQVPVREWINKILTEAVAAYYSHPSIWSEIGYAGPAYPRGYVRSELGLTDPWEARRDGK